MDLCCTTISSPMALLEISYPLECRTDSLKLGNAMILLKYPFRLVNNCPVKSGGTSPDWPNPN